MKTKREDAGERDENMSFNDASADTEVPMVTKMNDDIKALYIIVNAGYADATMEIVREAGAGGATILNARGTGALHKMFMGISLDTEKEIILSLVSESVADKIMADIKEKAGITTDMHGICFTLPVAKMTKLNKIESNI